MSEQYGALDVPIPVPADGASVADPFLDLLAAYIMAGANALTGDAWAKINPIVTPPHASPLPIAFVKTFQPRENDFRSNELPALFVYRGKSGKRLRVGQDILLVPTPVNLLWVPPRVEKSKKTLRDSFPHGLEAAFDDLLERGRHPAWVVAGDPDPYAADDGSFFYTFAKLYDQPTVLGGEPYELKLPSPENTRTTLDYDCFLYTIEIREAMTSKKDRYSPIDHIESTLELGNRDGAELGVLAFNFKPTLHTIAPASGPLVGGTNIAIVGSQLDDETTFTIGGALCTSVVRVDDRLFTAKTPAAALAGAKDVVATKSTGETATLVNGFTYV